MVCFKIRRSSGRVAQNVLNDKHFPIAESSKCSFSGLVQFLRKGFGFLIESYASGLQVTKWGGHFIKMKLLGLWDFLPSPLNLLVFS